MVKLLQGTQPNSYDFKTQTNTENNDGTNNQNIDAIDTGNPSNALLIKHLGNTSDFSSKLTQLPQANKLGDESNNDMDWALILIDCDDIGMLLNTKKISMTQAQNSINLLKESICKSISKSSDENKVFRYHL